MVRRGLRELVFDAGMAHLHAILEEERAAVRRAYLKRFPFAALMNTSLWIVELSHLKMPDYRLGFGIYRYWRRDE